MRRDKPVALLAPLATGAVVVALGFAVPVLLTQHGHALGVPRGDDWSYLRTLYRWVDTGRLDFNNWVTMTLVGQLVLAAPIALVRGHDTASVQMLTAVLGVVGLFATYAIARTCGVGRGAATFLAAVVAAGPFFGVLAVTFMTDVPGWAVATLSLAVGIVALRRRPVSLPLVGLTLALGLYAFTIREYGAIPSVGVALTAGYTLLTDHDAERDEAVDRRRVIVLLAMSAVAAVAALAFYAWWHTIPHPKPFPLGFPTSHAISTANVKGAGMLRLAGFWLLPALALTGPIAIVRRSWRASRVIAIAGAVVVGSWLVATGVKEPRNAFTGNYFIPEGALGRGVGSGIRPRLVPLRVFEVFVALGTVGAVVLVLAAVPAIVAVARALRRRDFPALDGRQLAIMAIALTITGFSGAYLVAALAGLPLYDRYTLPIVPLAGVSLLLPTAARETVKVDRARVSTWQLATAGAAFALLLAVGLDYTADSASYDGARWRVSEAAVRAGFTPRQVGGNFEWVNFYADKPGLAVPRRVCVLVTAGERAVRNAGGRLIAERTYHPPFRTAIPVVAVRRRECRAPSAPAGLKATGG